MQHISPQGIWNNSWTFCLAISALTIGLQSFWTLPVLLLQYDGFSFCVIYCAGLLLFGAPLLAAEMWLGREERCNPLRAVALLQAQSGLARFWRGLGPLLLFVGLLVFSYMVLLGGWSLNFLFGVMDDRYIDPNPEVIAGNMTQLLSDPNQLVRWQSSFLLMVVGVSACGIKNGVGFAVRLFIPLALILLLLLIANNVSLGAISLSHLDASFFLFQCPNVSAVVTALALALFTLSLGVGAVSACSAYMPQHLRLSRAIAGVLLVTVTFAVLVTLLISPLLSYANVEVANGPTLLFMSVPLSFSHTIQGAYFATLFYSMIVLILWSAAIVMLEPLTAWLAESASLPRYVAAIVAGAIAWLLSVIVSLSFNEWQGMRLFGYFTPFQLIENLSAKILIPAVVVLHSIFVALVLKTPKFNQYFASLPKIFSFPWLLHLGIVTPLVVVCIVWFSFRSIAWFQ